MSEGCKKELIYIQKFLFVQEYSLKLFPFRRKRDHDLCYLSAAFTTGHVSSTEVSSAMREIR